MKSKIIIFLIVVLVLVGLFLLTQKKEEIKEEKSELTIIGDSRMVGLCQYQFYKKTNGICIAEVGMGYDWFINTALKEVENISQDKKKYIAINLGVNDLYNANNYIKKYEDLTLNAWSDSKIILVSVNPTKYSYDYLNKEIDSFNLKLKELTKYDNIIYCDTASILKENDFVTNDGLHYEKETDEIIFDQIKKCILN